MAESEADNNVNNGGYQLSKHGTVVPFDTWMVAKGWLHSA